MEALVALFGASFVAATLFPLPSEAALIGYMKMYPGHTGLAVAAATLGNTAGGMTTYLLGRCLPQKKLDVKALGFLRRYGAPVTFLSMITTVFGAASGIHGSAFMIRSRALAVCSARRRWSGVVRASLRAAVICGSSKSS